MCGPATRCSAAVKGDLKPERTDTALKVANLQPDVDEPVCDTLQQPCFIDLPVTPNQLPSKFWQTKTTSKNAIYKEGNARTTVSR
eukprot:1534088-Amphidinium_carterae.1